MKKLHSDCYMVPSVIDIIASKQPCFYIMNGCKIFVVCSIIVMFIIQCLKHCYIKKETVAYDDRLIHSFFNYKGMNLLRNYTHKILLYSFIYLVFQTTLTFWAL